MSLEQCTSSFSPELCGTKITWSKASQIAPEADRILIIGQKLASASANPGQVYEYKDATAVGLFGAGSMIMESVEALFNQAGIASSTPVDVYVAPLTGTIGQIEFEITDTTTSGVGLASVFINGQLFQVPYNETTDTDDDVAARFAAIIDSQDTLTAAAVANTVTVETVNNGVVGGFLDFRLTYSGDKSVLGDGPTITKTVTPSSGFPDLSGLSSIDMVYSFVSNPYTDGASLTAVSAFLCSSWSADNDYKARAWSATTQADLASTQAVGDINDAFMSIIGLDPNPVTPPYIVSASYTGVAYGKLNFDSNYIASSIISVGLNGVLGSDTTDRWSKDDKVDLINSGITYLNTTESGSVSIGRGITTYTDNNGQLDISLRDVSEVSLIAAFDKSAKLALNKFTSGYAFRADGVVGSRAGSDKILTLAGVRNALAAVAQSQSDINRLQDVAGFTSSLDVTVEESTNCISIVADPNFVKPVCCVTSNFAVV